MRVCLYAYMFMWVFLHMRVGTCVFVCGHTSIFLCLYAKFMMVIMCIY